MSIFDQLKHDFDPHHFDPGRAIHDIQHGVQDAANSAQHAIQQAAHDAQGAIQKAGHDAEQNIRNVQHQMGEGLYNAKKDIEGGLHKAGDAIKQELKDESLKLAGAAAKEAIQKGMKTVRKGKEKMDSFRETHPDLVSAIDQVSVSVGLSVVTMSFSDWYSRADELLTAMSPFADDFSLTRTSIKNFMLATAPSSVDFGISGELFSNVLSASASLTVPGALAVELIDLLLEELGVPA